MVVVMVITVIFMKDHLLHTDFLFIKIVLKCNVKSIYYKVTSHKKTSTCFLNSFSGFLVED